MRRRSARKLSEAVKVLIVISTNKTIVYTAVSARTLGPHAKSCKTFEISISDAAQTNSATAIFSSGGQYMAAIFAR